MSILLKFVSLNIPIMSLVLLTFLGGYHSTSLAQTTNEDSALQSSTEPELTSQESVSEAAQNTNSSQPILRIEDTIRGNKEQPQVLTIVPWQLPVHQRINENTQWQLQVTQLSSIERNAFLRNLAVVKEMNAAQEVKEPTSPTK
jgi:hypothetical protein